MTRAGLLVLSLLASSQGLDRLPRGEEEGGRRRPPRSDPEILPAPDGSPDFGRSVSPGVPLPPPSGS